MRRPAAVGSGAIDGRDDGGGGGAGARQGRTGLELDAPDGDDGNRHAAQTSASASRPTTGSGLILLDVGKQGPKPM